MIQSALDVNEKTGESTVKNVEQFLDDARKKWQTGLDVDSIDRTEAESDNTFANATDRDYLQWSVIARQNRDAAHRPVLQWNRIPTYVQQVVNDGRQNKPAIKTTPGDGGTKETSEFFQNRIRHIEYDSDADQAYDKARDQQVTSGRGFIEIGLEYIPGTFDQRVRLKAIENQFSVVFDPSAQKYARSDAEWCFVVSRISKEEHARRYGPKSIVNQIDWTSSDNPAPTWIGVGDKGDLVQIADYWVREYTKRILCKLKDGQTAWKDELGDQYASLVALDEQARPIEREEQDCKIKHYVINGAEILSEDDWIGSTIPIVPIWGREAVVGGVRRTYSLIRMAKDPQRLVNLYVSNIAEQIAMMPKAPYVAPIGSIADNHLADWRDLGQVPKAIGFYKQWDQDGRELNKPERLVHEPPIQALTIGLQQAIDGIKSAMGIFDASLGQRSNETTGIAIERRKQSAEIINFHFSDNEARSRKRIGEILLELIPKIDKQGSTVPTRLEDGQSELVPVGVQYTHPKTGEEVIHNLDAGDYAVEVSTGPSYASARQEEHDRLAEIIKAAPELITVIGDQVMRTSDFPGADEIADRMENWIKQRNPGVIQDHEEGQKPLPPQVQAQIAGLQQELQKTQGFAQSLHEELQTKKPELDNKIQLERMRLDFEREKLQVTSMTQLNIAEIKAGVDADIEQLRLEIDRINKERGIQAAAQAADTAHQQAKEIQQNQHAQALEQSEQGHAQTLESQQQAAELAPQPEAK